MLGTVRRLLILPVVLLAAGCGGDEQAPDVEMDPVQAQEPLPEGAQARSLLGEVLYAPESAPEVQAEREAQLAEALADLEDDPESADALIWVGRRHAYLADYRRAIDVYTRAMELHPEDARLYRHRGHRYISVREFDNAEADLERAAELIAGTEDEVEPDGQPNERGIPLSTLHYNIWYHLGLVRYLQGDWEGSLEAYQACLEAAQNPDGVVACSYWLWQIHKRMGDDAAAAAVLEPITADMEIIENSAYHRLLLLFKGELEPEDLLGGGEDALQNTTVAYGVAVWHLLNGREERAEELFDEILDTDSQWAAFGYLAAEAEIARQEGG